MISWSDLIQGKWFARWFVFYPASQILFVPYYSYYKVVVSFLASSSRPSKGLLFDHWPENWPLLGSPLGSPLAKLASLLCLLLVRGQLPEG